MEKKIELVDSMEVQRRDRPRCLGIGNSTQVHTVSHSRLSNNTMPPPIRLPPSIILL